MSQGITNFKSFQSTSHFSGLDGLRGLSILLVIFHHVPRIGGWECLSLLQENGRYGVSLFFVISGFLITSLLLREKHEAGRISLGKFYARRTLRLFPLYYACLGLHCLLVWLGFFNSENRELFWEKLPAYTFYYSNWLSSATAGPFFQAWSLAVEEEFYLGFSLLFAWFRPKLLLIALATAIGVKFFSWQIFGPQDAVSPALRILFSYQEAILWGVLLAFSLSNRRLYGVLARIAHKRAVLPIISSAILAWLLIHPMTSSSTWDAQVLYLMMSLLVMTCVIRGPSRLIDNRLLVHVGTVSYGIYLLHMLVISAVKKIPMGNNPAICFLVSTAVVVLGATLVYRYFEAPIIRYYKHRFSPARSASSGALPAGSPGDCGTAATTAPQSTRDTPAPMAS